MNNKSFVSFLLVLALTIGILPTTKAFAVTPRTIPGFHVQETKTIQYAIHQQAYSRWDDTLSEWVQDHFVTTYVNPEIATLISGGFDDQTPQDGSNEFNKEKQDVEPTHKPDGTPNVYMAYEADYWGYFVLYMPDVPVQTTGKVTVKYIDEATSLDIATPDVFQSVEPGSHGYTAKSITGYTHNDSLIKSVTVEAGKEYTVTFKYTRNIPPVGTGNVTVRYVDTSNIDVSTPDNFSNVTVGLHTYSAKLISGYTLQGSGSQSVTVESGKNHTTTFIYKKDIVIPKEIPIVTLSVPSTVYVGDNVYIGGAARTQDVSAKSLSAQISINGSGVNGTSLIYGSNTFDSSSSNKIVNVGDTVWFSEAKTYTVTIIGYDDNGNQATPVTKEVTAIIPSPTALITKGGYEKENRKVFVDFSGSSGGSARTSIDWSKSKTTITALSGGTNTDIRVQTHTIGSTNGDILIDSSRSINKSLEGLNMLDMLFKKAGQYKVSLTVTNTYGKSNAAEIIITIAEDLAPTIETYFPSVVYRNPKDNAPNGYAQSTTPFTDDSKSIDGDIIAKRAYILTFDTDNNDGKVSDELAWGPEMCYIYDLDYNGINQIPDEGSVNPHLRPIVVFSNIKTIDIDTINTGNLTEYVYKSTSVGHYLISRIVKEEFGQETIPQFVTISDRRSANDFDEPY